MKKCKCSDNKIYDVPVEQTCYSFCTNIGFSGGSNFINYVPFDFTINENIVALGEDEVEAYKKQKEKNFTNFSKIITNFFIDDENIPSSGDTRRFSISGTPGSVFTLKVENEDPLFYDFTTKTFTAENSKTKLKKIKIPNSSLYTGTIVFPAVTDDDIYKITLEAHAENSTTISGGRQIINETISQFTDTTVTFDGFTTSSSYSSTGSTTVTPLVTDGGKQTFSVSMSLTLSSDSMAIKRQPIEEDFEVKTTKEVVASAEMPHRNTAGSDFFRYSYTDVSNITAGGRPVSGARISAGTTIPEDSSQFIGFVGDDFNGNFSKKDVDQNPSVDYKRNTIIISTESNLPGGSNVDFYYPITNQNQTENIYSSLINIKNIDLSLDTTTTTTSSSTIGSSTTQIGVASTNGIEKHVQTTVNGTTTKSNRVIVASGTGIYVGQILYNAGSSSLTNDLPVVTAVSGTSITLSTPQSLGNGHQLSFSNSIINSNNMLTSTSLNFVPVINISGSNIFANTAQELENGETITISKTGRNATLTFDVAFSKVGSTNFTVFPNLDNFIEVI